MPKTAEQTVADLEARIKDVRDDLKAKKDRLQEVEAERVRKLNLYLRRARLQVKAKERKRRTRRLILIGTYVESKTKDDPEASARLLHGLDAFLDRTLQPGTLRPRPPPGASEVNDDGRKLADQIRRMRLFVASQEATIQAKVEELAEALGRSVEDTEALLRAHAGE